MGKKSFLYIMGRTYAANIVANGTSHSGGKFPCSILDKYTEVCKSLITEPNAHANNRINIGDYISLKPVVQASTILSKSIID